MTMYSNKLLEIDDSVTRWRDDFCVLDLYLYSVLLY